MAPNDVWQALAVCGVCAKPVPLLDPIRFIAPKPLGKWDYWGKPPQWDGWRFLHAALYFRDPFHSPELSFVNYCSAACSLADSSMGHGQGGAETGNQHKDEVDEEDGNRRPHHDVDCTSDDGSGCAKRPEDIRQKQPNKGKNSTDDDEPDQDVGEEVP